MAKDKPWHNLEKMLFLYAQDNIKSDEDVAAYFSDIGYEVSRRAITDARKSLGIPAKSKASLFQVEPDELADASSNKEEVWELVFRLQSELRKEDHSITDAKIDLEINEPIGVFFMGDLHIGDVGTDHKALLRDVQRIQETENLYGTLGGDYINNFILNHRKIKNHEVLPVEFAWMLCEDLFERLKDSLWMILLGNHDAWTDTAAEIDKLGELVKKLGVPYGKHGANVWIKFPDGMHYKIRLRHKFRFESGLNLLNAVKQMYRFDQPFDIGVLHHLHQPGIEAFMQPPTGQCWAIRPGSYKVEDDFAYSLGYTSTGFGQSRKFGTDDSCQYSIPVAVLWPGTRKIQVIPNIVDGIEYLGWARDQWRKGNINE